MALFSRDSQPPVFNSSRRYKPFLRVDFRTRCAYCERTEEYMGGEESFEVEHLHPKSKFPQLDCVYSNLYYACRGCNAHKSETWPSEEQIAQGMRFADPCATDPYVHDLVEEADGSVTGITPSGMYTRAHIRLHRADLKRWRRLRAQALTDLPVFAASIAYFEQLHSLTRGPEHEELATQISVLKSYVEETKRRFRID